MKYPKIVYVFDVLCSWCFAFGPVVEALLRKYPDFDFQLVSGGLAIGPHKMPYKARFADQNTLTVPHLKEMYAPVMEHGKAPISEDFFKLVTEEEVLLDSEAHAVALSVFKTYGDNRRLDLSFAHSMQNQFFVKGINPGKDQYLDDVLVEFQLPIDGFRGRMSQPGYLDEAKQEFKYAKDLQADSFPRLFLQTSDSQYYLVAKGFTTEEDLTARIERILKSEEDEK